MSFRENLQYLRGTRNMTQEQLAMLLGVSRQAISKWESEKAYPEMDKLLMICDLFGVTLDDLVTFADRIRAYVNRPPIRLRIPGRSGLWPQLRNRSVSRRLRRRCETRRNRRLRRKTRRLRCKRITLQRRRVPPQHRTPQCRKTWSATTGI